jgi:hypothetical protein
MNALANTLTIADIKRGGMAALDLALHRGAATIMKRNRPAAVVLTPDAYEDLVRKASHGAAPSHALDWLLSAPALPKVSALDGAAMAKRLSELSSDWPHR